MSRRRASGPRSFQGELLDVAAVSRLIGITEKSVRARLARGLLPHRRFGARIVFVRREILEFIERLPGVSTAEALANVATRNGDVGAR